MTVRQSMKLWSRSKIRRQRFEFFSSIRSSGIKAFVLERGRYFQISFDLLSSHNTHEVDNQSMNSTIGISVSIISNTRQYRATHIKQNTQKCFNLSTRGVVSRSLLVAFFISLQTSLEIDVFRHYLKKIRENEKLKNRNRDLILRSKHVAGHGFTKWDV